MTNQISSARLVDAKGNRTLEKVPECNLQDPSKTMISRKNSRSSVMAKSVPNSQMKTHLRILSDEEELEKDINFHPELQSSIQKFDQFLKLLQTAKVDNARLLSSLKSDVSSAFETFTTESLRSILSRHLAVRGFAEGIARKYESLASAIGAQVLTADFMVKHQKVVETQLLVEMRKVLWTSSDCSFLLVERIVSTPLLKYFLDDVKAAKRTLPNVSDDNLVFDTAVGIMYNCSKNHVTRPHFRELKAADTLLPFLKATSKKIKLTVVLFLAHIVDDSNNRLLKADGSVFDFLIDMIRTALSDANHKSYQSNVYFTTKELVCGLKALAKNDTNKRVLVEKGALKPLELLLKTGSEAEQQEALYCVRELAFNSDNKSAMNADDKIMHVLKEKAESSNTQIAKAARLTRWGLASEKLLDTPGPGCSEGLKRRESSISKSIKLGHVMLSYSWSNQKRVLQIYERLKTEGLLLWVDVDDMAGSTLEAMAGAVERASAIIMFVSEMYSESQNCRQEAEYSFKLKKTIIPVMLQPDFRPTGWLGMIIATTLYFDFSHGQSVFDSKMKELIKALGDSGRTISEDQLLVDPAITPGAAEPALRATSKVSTWTNKEVLDWLKRINMEHCSALKTLTGEELAFLQQLSYRAPEFYFGYLERKLNLKAIKELMTFANQLSTL